MARCVLTLNFSDRYTTPCASSIQNGLSPMVIVRHANLTNRAWLSRLDFFWRNRIDRPHNQSNSKPTKNCDYHHTKTHALAFAKTRCAALTGGDSTLVRRFQPFNWSNDRTPRRLVRHLVDDLLTRKGRDRKRYEPSNRSKLSSAWHPR